MQTFSLNISFNSSQSQKAQFSFSCPSESFAQNNICLLNYSKNEQQPNHEPPQVERFSSNCSGNDYFETNNCLSSPTISQIDYESILLLDRTSSEETFEGSSDKMMKNSRKIKKEVMMNDQSKKKETGSSKKVKWTPEEDKKIFKLIAKHGPKWTIIAEIMGGRAGKQVRERYLNVLKPGINHREWTEEEDNLFMSLYQKFGKRWCQIAEYLPGRTESQVKNRFYTQSRKQTNLHSIQRNDSKADSCALFSEAEELALDELRSKTLSSPSLSKESSIDSFFGFDIEEDPYFAKLSFNHDEIKWN